MYTTAVMENKNENKGKVISFIVHALLLLIAFYYCWPKIDPLDINDEKPPYAVKVDFTFEESSMSKVAHDDAGAQRPKAEAAPQEEATKPAETTQPQEIEATKPQVLDVPKPDIKMPTPVVTPTLPDPIYTPTPVEEAPVKVVEKPRVESPKPPVTVPKTVPAKTGSTSPSTSNGSTAGTSNTKPSTVDGKQGGTGKGEEGTGAGKTKGNDGDEGLGNSSDGTGEYDGTGDGSIFGRKVVYRDVTAVLAAVNTSGTAAVKICVNRAGVVTFSEIIPEETTIRDRATLKKF
ncbi:MAG: hypothetical protein IPO92_17875 [Saprospiraceae bacterium]|nr:hypothetical protein [Saprospiraceae bacterium]